MTEFKRMWNWFKVGAAAFVLTFAAGCESGGGGETQTGAVSVLVTDAPTRNFLSFKVLVSRIELIGRRTRATIKTEESEFDLLRLENLSSLFAQTPAVPVGVYRKIRLTIKRIELVDRRTRNRIYPLTRSEFHLDLVPRRPFEVTADSRLLVEIDIDARRSVRWRSGRYWFRPVVFVKVGVEEISHLVEVRGVVGDVDLLNDTFRICRVDETEAGVTVSDECLTAHLSDDSSIFNPNGAQGSINDLVATEIVKVVGNLDAADDSRIDVDVVERDALSAYVTLYGSVLSAPDAASTFELTMDADQDASDDATVNVQLQAGTKVFDASGAALDASAISPDQTVEATGVLAVSPADADTLWAEWLIVSDSAPELETLTGYVLARNETDVTLYIATGNRCARILPDADVQVVTESSSGNTNEAGELADLVLGREVDLYGTEAGDGCFEAQSVVVFVIAD